jgi:hypothetical protein
MIRSVISVLIVILVAVSLSSCSSSKKSNTELRGLMLLENTQLGRNKGYYSKHKSTKLKKSYKKYEKKKKKRIYGEAAEPSGL